MQDCVFCKIVAGDVNAFVVYEDESVIAFLDHMPIRKGHTLIVSKTHYETILDIPDEKLAHLIQVTKKVAGHLKVKLDAKGLRVSNNNYAAARQVVPHIHFHVIPITADHPYKFRKTNRLDMTDEEFEQLLAKIRLT